MRHLIVLLCPVLLFGDGGTVLLQQNSGPFFVTIFGAPVPLRAGPVDLSVMVQTRNTLTPVLDADVLIHIRGETQHATRNHSQNKLLYAATFNIPEAGEIGYTVTVCRNDAENKLRGSLQLAPPPQKSETYWGYLAIPLVMIALFALHQRLKRTRTIHEVVNS